VGSGHGGNLTGKKTMRRTFIIAAALAVFAGAAGAAYADGPYKLDATGKCHGPKGFVTKSFCATPAAGLYKLDAKGKCHGAKGYVKQSLCKA
jgi:hypothetical protein